MSAQDTDIQASITSERIANVLKSRCTKENLCPVKDILANYGDKWSMYTVLLLGQYGKMRFKELKSGIHGISQRMLTVTLRTLEEDGIVIRTIYPEIPPKVEYELSHLGYSLMQRIVELASWADEHLPEILRARKKYQRRTV
ncbi:transcriptional regulator [Segetibacter sp. 3557_3]|uniref:winged helix-turn-helix transcriptional regulator n=1 Tax=Segetibacter sp. 3557_3 TaxID=2547429 RepID=UPI0010584BF0|nr:helix-turn-helix domain-containing protein [Segetibacter sp. 3557_3]TDH21382.1 transcriptional regulator [Segetibacter sp. 3557_3]